MKEIIECPQCEGNIATQHIKKTMMKLTHHCLFYFAVCFTFYFTSYINHSSEC